MYIYKIYTIATKKKILVNQTSSLKVKFNDRLRILET